MTPNPEAPMPAAYDPTEDARWLLEHQPATGYYATSERCRRLAAWVLAARTPGPEADRG